MKDAVIGLVGLFALLVAVWQALKFLTANGGMSFGMNHLVLSLVAFLVAVGSVVAYFMLHPRVEEEIHITK